MPKITGIEPQKRNKDRSNIYVDEQFVAGASNFVIRANRLEVGKEVNVELLKKIIHEDSLEKAKEYVVRYHIGKPEKKVRDKLKEKGYEPEIIEETIVFMNKYHYIDDLKYAKSFTKSKQVKDGKRKITQALKQKGISNEEIEEALSQVSEEDEYEAAKNLLESKIEKYRKRAENKYELKRKLYAFLGGRGFSSDIISRVLENLE